MNRIARFIAPVAKVVTLAIGLSYFLGFVSVALDLMSYGLLPTGLAKADYLAIGFMTFIFLTALASFGFFLEAVTFSASWRLLKRSRTWETSRPSRSVATDAACRLLQRFFLTVKSPPLFHPLLLPPYSTLFLGLSLIVLMFYANSSSFVGPSGWLRGFKLSMGFGAFFLISGSLLWDPIRRPGDPPTRCVLVLLFLGTLCAWVVAYAPIILAVTQPSTNRMPTFAVLVSFACNFGFFLLLVLSFSRLAGSDRFLWLRAGIFMLLLLGFIFSQYVIYVYPQLISPFGGRKPFVRILLEERVEIPASAQIPVEMAPTGAWIGPAYVILEKPDSIVLSAFPWICDEIRPRLSDGTLLSYIELPRGKIRERYPVSRQLVPCQMCR